MSVVPVAALYYEQQNHMRILRNRLRDKMNPFDIPQERFKEMYRMPINLTINFIEEVREAGEIVDSMKKVPLHLEILAVLNFFASGSYQRRVGGDALAYMSQSKISNCIRKYATIIAEKLSGKYVRFPQTNSEIESTKASFLAEYGFPHILGLVDGTHIAIAGLKKNVEHSYVNRKGFHSINTQLICNNSLEIINCNARYCGSTHDSYIWSCSQSFAFLQLRYEQGHRHEWLLGDSGYPLQPFLLTNIQRPRSREEERYNQLHAKIRSKIERCIGLLKNRFRCILGERKLRYEPRIVSNIITSCVILHNILIKHNVTHDEPIEAEEQVEEPSNNERGSLFVAGQQSRDFVMNYMNSTIR